MRLSFHLVVYGRAAPQGSKKFVGKSTAGRAIMVESSTHVAPWRELVHAAAVTARGGRPPLDGPLLVRMVFTMARPKSAKAGARPATTPDLSKLARSTEDALTNAGVWTDDARVVEYERLAKVYPGSDPEALEAPGVRIVVRPIGERQASLLEASTGPTRTSR
jgi:Holliday junction resolvase RusA-like endonuclease